MPEKSAWPELTFDQLALFGDDKIWRQASLGQRLEDRESGIGENDGGEE
jgi:hypothetical protein